jgi:ERCC4-type nuclease
MSFNDTMNALRDFTVARGVFSRAESIVAMGPKAASILPRLVAEGHLINTGKGIFALAHIRECDPRMIAALDRQEASRPSRSRVTKAKAPASEAEIEAAVVAAIDRARAEFEQTASDPALASKAILRLWQRDAKTAERRGIARVYIEITGYPAFYGQMVAPRGDGSGDIAWDSINGAIGPVEARALARKVFDPVPVFFRDLAAHVPNGLANILPLVSVANAHEDLDVLADPAPVSPELRHMLPCAYVVSDTERLDPSSLKHPLPEQVRLLVDRREPAAIITALRRVPNLLVELADLQAASFIVPDRLVIARRTNEAFNASLANGAKELIADAEALSATGMHRIMLIEGGPYSQRTFVLNRLASTLSYLSNCHHVHLTPTMNAKHSAYVTVQAIKHSLFGMFTSLQGMDPIDKREATQDPSLLARALIGNLKGVSNERVNALVGHFGTLKAIAAANVEELCKVPGIGKKTASHIAEVFGHSIR